MEKCYNKVGGKHINRCPHPPNIMSPTPIIQNAVAIIGQILTSNLTPIFLLLGSLIALYIAIGYVLGFIAGKKDFGSRFMNAYHKYYKK